MIEINLALSRTDFLLDVDLKIPSTGVTVLFGASGSGKSTLLRCIAGLEHAKGGLSVNGKIWQDDTSFLPPHKRQVGYVFQEASLFPHLTVMQNLQYGLQRQKQADMRFSLDSLIDLLGIAHLLTRKPAKLSGGEKQRIAIARALAVNPQVLLMDEPMSALDMARKLEVLPFLEKLRDELAMPVIYVTHASNELIRLADHMIVLNAGKVIAEGDLNSTMAQIDHPSLAAHTPNVVVEANITGIDREWHLVKASFNEGAIWLRDQNFALNQTVRFMVMDKDVSIARTPQQDSSISNTLPATVHGILDGEHPAICIVRLKLGQTYLLSRLTRRSLQKLNIQTGDKVWAQVKLAAIVE